MEPTKSFTELLQTFRSVFTKPSFAAFQLLVAGWIGSHRHRYVTDLIVSSNSTRNRHFSDYHRFFSHARWSIDELWKTLAKLPIEKLIGPDARIRFAGDDTLCEKRGFKLFGAGMHHNPLISSKAMKLVKWGHDWVIRSLLIVHPWWAPTKVFALPIGMRLYRNRQGVAKGGKQKNAGGKKQARRSKAKQKSNTKRSDSARRFTRLRDGIDPDAIFWLPPFIHRRSRRWNDLRNRHDALADLVDAAGAAMAAWINFARQRLGARPSHQDTIQTPD